MDGPNREEIKKAIEKLRKEMHELMRKKSLSDEEMIRKSTEIDVLLMEYMKLLEMDNKKKNMIKNAKKL